MKKSFLITVIVAVLFAAFAAYLILGEGNSQLVWDLSNQGSLLLPLVLVAAIIDSINPCSFSVLILTIVFLFSIGRIRRQILAVGGVYILGIFVAYMLLGLGILRALHLFSTPHFMGKLGALILIIFGLVHIINRLFPKFPIKFKIPRVAHNKIATLMEKATVPTAFMLGILVGLCEFPCTGGPYLMVLGLLHDNTTYWSGLGYLLLYNAIFVLPLVIMLALAGHPLTASKIQKWQKSEKKYLGIIASIAMIILGLLIILF